MNNSDIVSINNLKMLAIDMINTAGSGHPGITLSAAPIMYDIYSRHLKINPSVPNWITRDRFVISCGHASSLTYAMLYMAGYDLSLDDLRNFRKLGSNTPGLLEYGMTPGIEATTGALGSGVANAVGLALSERYLHNLTKTPESKINLIDYFTYVLVGDGDLMEGISDEALSFAGSQKLNKLIVLYDSNDVSLDGTLENVFNCDILKKYSAMGFDTYIIKDAYNLKELDKVIQRAKKSEKPTFIQIKTIFGKDSLYEGKNTIHGKPLDVNDYNNLRTKLNIKTNPFEISKEAILHIRNQISTRNDNIYNTWKSYHDLVINSGNTYLIETIRAIENKIVSINFIGENYKISDTYQEELRNSNNQIMEIISGISPLFITSSADLFSSCKNIINKSSINNKENPLEKNIQFGVREAGMAGILNGMALNGMRVSGSTFLAFSDYLKPQIRLSALMNLPVTYIFTHDSIKVGSDGPTHQPIEQLASLRAIPNFSVYRPADVTEIIGCWENILKNRRPSALILSKEKIKKIPTSNSNFVKNGGYIIKKENGPIDAIIISTGDNVVDAIKIADTLYLKGKNIRVVSMPSQELFMESGIEYQKEVLPDGIKIIVIEPSSPMSWDYFTSRKYILSLNEFGYSGDTNSVLKHFSYDYESLLVRVDNLTN